MQNAKYKKKYYKDTESSSSSSSSSIQASELNNSFKHMTMHKLTSTLELLSTAI